MLRHRSGAGGWYRGVIAVMVAVAKLLVSVSAFADTGPTVDATSAWLASNLPPVFVEFDGILFVQQSAKYTFSGCDMTVDVTIERYATISDRPDRRSVFSIVALRLTDRNDRRQSRCAQTDR